MEFIGLKKSNAFKCILYKGLQWVWVFSPLSSALLKKRRPIFNPYLKKAKLQPPPKEEKDHQGGPSPLSRPDLK